MIDGEKSAGGPVFWCHVGNGGLIRQGKVIEAVTEKLDEFSDDPFAPQHFHDGQHQVCCGCPFG